MGLVYKRQVRFCRTCKRRLDTKAQQTACAAAHHAVEFRDQGPWWVKYQVNGRPVQVSSGSERKADAERLLRQREHLVDTGAPAAIHAAKVTFDETAADLINDYVTNKRRSLRTVRIRLAKHLTPYFQRRRLAAITTADARAYVVHRQAAGWP